MCDLCRTSKQTAVEINERAQTRETIDRLTQRMGETGLAPAPKEQPPRKLSGKRTVFLQYSIWKASCEASDASTPPKG